MLMKSPHSLEPSLRYTRRATIRLGGLMTLGALLGRPGSLLATGPNLGGMRAAAQYSAEHSGLSFLVMKDGQVIYQDYPNGHSEYEAHKIYSGTKGFWILAALRATEEGIIDLDDRVANTLPEWNTDAGKARVTLRQLLSFSSGLDATNSLHGDGFENRDAMS